MPPRVDPVLTTSELPAKADVVVIGGGIVGAIIALFLAERGVSVVLCESRAAIGAGAARRAAIMPRSRSPSSPCVCGRE